MLIKMPAESFTTGLKNFLVELQGVHTVLSSELRLRQIFITCGIPSTCLGASHLVLLAWLNLVFSVHKTSKMGSQNCKYRG